MTTIETVLFPNVVGVLLAYLRGHADLTGVPCLYEVPRVRPDKFVTVTRTGGARSGEVIDRAQITVECWSGKPEAGDAAAHDLAQLVRALLHDARGTVLSGETIYEVTEISGPYPARDPDSRSPRWRQTFQIGARGAPQ